MNSDAIARSLLKFSEEMVMTGQTAEELAAALFGISSFMENLKTGDTVSRAKLQQFRQEICKLRQRLTAVTAHCSNCADTCSELDHEFKIALAELTKPPTH